MGDILTFRDEKTNRFIYWDILKGLGIMAIVIGHSWRLAGWFMYTFHLALFFLVIGFFYNESAYKNKPFQYVGNRIKNSWGKYVLYICVLVLGNHLLMNIGAYQDFGYLTKKDMLRMCLNSIVFKNGTGSLGGAFWMIVPLIVAGCIFAGIVSFADQICGHLRKKQYDMVVIFLISMAVGVVGGFLNIKKIELEYHIHTSLVMIPIVFCGYYIRKTKIQLHRYMTWYGAGICFLALYYLVKKKGYYIELSEEMIYSMRMFLLITFLGLYVCFYGAKVIIKNRLLTRMIAFLGTYTFEIMALHFTVFKLIDVIYGNVRSIPQQEFSAFPTAFSSLWLVYIVFGCSIPALVGYALDQSKKQLSLSLVRFFKQTKDKCD